jgi:hypothetical protein
MPERCGALEAWSQQHTRGTRNPVGPQYGSPKISWVGVRLSSVCPHSLSAPAALSAVAMAAAYLTTIRHNPRLRAVAAILAVLFLGWTLISAYPRPHGRLLAQNVEWSGPAWYSLPRPPSNAPAPPPPVVFALLFLGARTAEEGSQMIKSALMHLSVPAHFHIVCTPDACAYVGQRFALMPRPAYEVQITLHEVKYEQLVARVQRAGLSGNYHQLAKLFLHEVLPVEVELAMFIDADMLFIRASLQAWQCCGIAAAAQAIRSRCGASSKSSDRTPSPRCRRRRRTLIQGTYARARCS